MAGLLITSDGQEVTAEKIGNILNALNVPCVPKVASMFAISAERYSSIMASANTVSAPVVATSSPAAAAKEEKVEEEESSEVEIGF
ncbi:hypothetical protein ENBRE01_0454 [Enteropsectra breve]|nr:hypothetical protein ENBRE01_0454 [Enteropsectra breve]